MSIRITCITKSNGNHENPHEAVQYYGWVEDGTGKHARTDRQTMVKWVLEGVDAYVKDYAGRIAWCFVNKSRNGTLFLQTHADGKPTDNLLSLPEC